MIAANTPLRAPASGNGPSRIGESFEELMERWRKPPSEEEIAWWNREEARRRRQERREREHKRLEVLIRDANERYRDVEIDNFRADTARQRQVLDSIRDYAANLKELAKCGGNIMLYGAPGTGKTHLLVALAKEAIRTWDLDVRYVRGPALQDDLRRQWGTRAGCTADVDRLCRAGILVLDDPFSSDRSLAWYTDVLKRIADDRWSACLPTWLALNVTTKEEAECLSSAPIVDRWSAGAIVEYFDWKSYRVPRKRRTQTGRSESPTDTEDVAPPPVLRPPHRAAAGESCYRSGEVPERSGSAATAAERKHRRSGVGVDRAGRLPSGTKAGTAGERSDTRGSGV